MAQAQTNTQVMSISPDAPVMKAITELHINKALTNLLPEFVNPKEFLAAAANAVYRNPALLSCTPASMQLSLLHLAQLGLLPATPLNHAHLVPFQGKVMPIIDYRGLIWLGVRSGAVAKVQTKIIYEKDIFEIEEHLTDRGLETIIKHSRDWAVEDRGEAFLYVSVIVFKDPNMLPNVLVMTKNECHAIGKKSPGYSNPSMPWKQYPDWMCLKTCIKQNFKLVPMTRELSDAIELDNSVEGLGLLPNLPNAPEAPPAEVPPSKTSSSLKQTLKGKSEAVTAPVVDPEDPSYLPPPDDEHTTASGAATEPEDEEDFSILLTEGEAQYLNGLFQHYAMKPAAVSKWLAQKFGFASVESIPSAKFNEVKKAALHLFKANGKAEAQ